MTTLRNFLLHVLVLAVCLCVAAPAGAALIQHLDATVAGSVVTDGSGVVTQWTDQSGAGNHATPGLGDVIYPSTIAFPGGPAGLDFGETRNSLVLLPSAATDWLNFNAGATGGFAVFVAFRVNALGGTWNDVVGNSTVVADGFLMRHHGADGRIQAALDGTINMGNDPVAAGETIIYGFNYDAATVAYDFWDSKNDSAVTGTRVAANFSRTFDFTLGTMHNGNRYFRGLIGEVLIFDSALSPAELDQVREDLVYKWITPPEEKTAFSAPSPADGAEDVPLEGNTLSWKQRVNSTGQADLYFGIHFDDVNTATPQNDPAGVYVGRQSQAAVALARLEYSQIYYWRVDEVNSAPDATVSKGDIWSFTTEPFSIPISNITATASSSFGPSGPEKTIDGSGLVDDLHGTSAGDMWVATTIPATVEYAFDRAYKLHELWLWNSNQLIETFVGFGAKEVVIEYSLDGENWTVLKGVGPLAQAPGAPGYAHNNTIDLGGATAQYVRMTIISVQGIATQVSLSEVRFFFIPTAATRPHPETGATDVAPDVMLSWGRDGREADRHEIYLGTDPADLALAGTVNESSFDTLALDLQLGQTYHWRVDEVNEAMDPSVWRSDTWSFTTTASILIDDMESYQDAEFLEIWATWIDGFDDPSNGSVVGADPALGDYSPERGIVQGGRQSLPIHYDNGAVAQSEATRNFEAPQDWTAHGVQSLVLYFQGSATNTGGNLNVKINDTKVAYDGDAGNLMRVGWNKWAIILGDVAGANLSSVRSLSIGVEGGGAGVVYIDDISLTTAGERDLVTPAEPVGGLVVYLPFDGDFQDASGNGLHGAAMGSISPALEAGVMGQAVALDGIDQYIAITGYQGIVADRTDPDHPVQQTFTVACWIKTTENGEMVTWGSADGGPVGGQYSTFRLDGGSLRAEHGDGNLRGNTTVNDGQWHHAALVVVEGGNLRVPQTMLYVDGVADGTFSGSDNLYNVTADADVNIGRRSSHGDRYFPGSIDEVRIYDRALTDAEIAWLAGRTQAFDKP